MPATDLQRFDTPEALARRVAADWIEAIRAAAREGRQLTVALSGGRIAKTFFEATTQLAFAEAISFRNVEIFWADERCVPATHEDSNYKLAKLHLLDPLSINPARVHPLAGADDCRSKAHVAAEHLKTIAPLNAAGVPELDIVFLGMGEDAHVASLFPQENEPTRNLTDIFRPVIASKPPPQRITMGYPVIAAAKNVWVLASGKGKEAALAESQQEGANTPLARVLQSRATTRIYTDI